MRAWLLALGLSSSWALAEPKSLHLGLLTNVPEATGFEAAWNFTSKLAIQGTYSWPLPVKVEVGVPSKKLVESGDFAISSPYLDIPFAVDFGPQYSLGFLLFPFGGSFHLGLAAAHRVVTIQGQVTTPVYFQDQNTKVESNSLFAADVRSRTEQDLVRVHIGNRWHWRALYAGWYLGAVHPLSGHSRVETAVHILNPNASESDGTDADNLEEARRAQEAILHDRAVQLLHRWETQTLPLLGFEIGLAF